MPKLIDYPRASLRASLELAKAVDELGGNCSIEMAAERLGKKVSGAFRALISASVKYGFIETKSQKLHITALYRDYKLAYNEEEKNQKLRESFLQVPLFKNLYNRFSDKELPVSHFEKLLIREFDVPDDIGSRVASYFIDGAKVSGLLGDNNFLLGNAEAMVKEVAIVDAIEDVIEPVNSNPATFPKVINKGTEYYSVQVIGPGTSFSIEIKELDDMQIVHAILKKIERTLQENGVT